MMLAMWMVSAVLGGGVVVTAAALADRSAGSGRRWLWGGALAATVAFPFVAPILRELLLAPSGLEVIVGSATPVVGGALGGLASPTVSGGRWSVDTLLVGAWLGSSLALFTVIVLGVRRVRRARNGWVARQVDGIAVLESRDMGPAVVGLLDPVIVLPRWVLELPPQERSLILAHEEEHRRRRDPLLLGAALVAPILMPWNPAVWWAFLRLREAVETDCDGRVLAWRGSGALQYARLLVDVGARTATPVPLGAGFGEARSSLERRVRRILHGGGSTSRRGLAVRALAAGVILAAACSFEVNVHITPDQESAEGFAATEVRGTDAPAAAATEERSSAPADREIHEPAAPPTSGATEEEAAPPLADGPAFTPFTEAPSILNRREVVAAIETAYPPLLRDAGVYGTVHVYFFIDAEGGVERTVLNRSSGHQALDAAALGVADVFRFAPAKNRGVAVPVWVSFPITFRDAPDA